MPPIWSQQVCQSLVSRYQDDLELWQKACDHLATEAEKGADANWIASCFDALEREWRIGCKMDYVVG